MPRDFGRLHMVLALEESSIDSKWTVESSAELRRVETVDPPGARKSVRTVKGNHYQKANPFCTWRYDDLAREGGGYGHERLIGNGKRA